MKSFQSHTLHLNGKAFINQDVIGVSLSGNSLESLAIAFFQEWTNELDFIQLQTSGSTGTPKRMLVLKQSMINSAWATIRFLGLGKGMKALLCLSPDFIAGKMMLVRAMLAEMEIVTGTGGKNPLENIETNIDFAAMVPLQLHAILEQNPEKLSLIRTLIIGGSSMDASLEAALQLQPTRCFHTYAMTESLSHIALRPVNGAERSDWFTPFENIEIGLDDRDCLQITAPGLFENTLTTNDVAIIDKSGRFRILGRTDDVIISAGMKIHPAETERKLADLFKKPFIISSISDPAAGEKVLLYCEESLSIRETYHLWEKLTERLNTSEMPRQIVSSSRILFLESGKIDRRSMRLGQVSR